VFRVPAIEQALKADFSAGAIAAIKVPETGLMSDMHGSAPYRAALITVMAGKALASA
jgi:carbon-monoxide dehydrogenase medium subunit